MPLGQTGSVSEVGFGKQTAEGSALANPEYATPLFTGLPAPMQSVTPVAVTDLDVVVPSLLKTEAHWEYAGEVPVFSRGIGRLLKGILPTDTLVGAGDPYTHTFSFAGADVWYSFFANRPGPQYEQFTDGLIEELSFTVAEDLVKCAVKAKGKSFNILAGAYTYGTPSGTIAITACTEAGNLATFTTAAHGFQPGQQVTVAGVTPAGYNGTWLISTVPSSTTFTAVLATSGLGAGSVFGTVGLTGQERFGGDQFLIPAGATLKLDLDVTPAVTTLNNLAGATITLTRPVSIEPTSDSLIPVFLARGIFNVAVALDLVWKDYNAYKSSYFGSKTAAPGTIPQQNLVSGSLDFLWNFVLGPNATVPSQAHSLELGIPQVTFLMPKAPEPDVTGKAIHLALDGMVTKPAAGASSIITATLKNNVSTAY
jgi:hypothetical protein